MSGSRRRPALAARWVPVLGTALLLTSCSSPGSAPAGSTAAGSTPAGSTSAGPVTASSTAEGDAVDLCAALPDEEVSPVLSAYGFTVASATPGTQDGLPTCVLASTDGQEVRLALVAEPFEEVVEGQLGPADAPPEDGSVWLPQQGAFAATAGDRTLLVTERGAGVATPTVLFLTGTALSHLP